MLCPSSTLALPSSTVRSFEPARSPCNTCNTNHCLSWDVNNVVVPSSFFVCAKQWLSRVVKSLNAPPKSVRSRFGRRASSAALYKLFVYNAYKSFIEIKHQKKRIKKKKQVLLLKKQKWNKVNT